MKNLILKVQGVQEFNINSNDDKSFNGTESFNLGNDVGVSDIKDFTLKLENGAECLYNGRFNFFISSQKTCCNSDGEESSGNVNALSLVQANLTSMGIENGEASLGFSGKDGNDIFVQSLDSYIVLYS